MWSSYDYTTENGIIADDIHEQILYSIFVVIRFLITLNGCVAVQFFCTVVLKYPVQFALFKKNNKHEKKRIN